GYAAPPGPGALTASRTSPTVPRSTSCSRLPGWSTRSGWGTRSTSSRRPPRSTSPPAWSTAPTWWRAAASSWPWSRPRTIRPPSLRGPRGRTARTRQRKAEKDDDDPGNAPRTGRLPARPRARPDDQRLLVDPDDLHRDEARHRRRARRRAPDG